MTLYEASRHSFCTQIVESGINTLQAKLLMRHSDERSTQKYFQGNIAKLRAVVTNRVTVKPLRSEKIEVKVKLSLRYLTA